MTVQVTLWAVAGAALVVALAAGVAEARRPKRRDLDRPGLLPLGLIQMLALFAALVAAVLALKA